MHPVAVSCRTVSLGVAASVQCNAIGHRCFCYRVGGVAGRSRRGISVLCAISFFRQRNATGLARPCGPSCVALRPQHKCQRIASRRVPGSFCLRVCALRLPPTIPEAFAFQLKLPANDDGLHRIQTNSIRSDPIMMCCCILFYDILL